MVLASSLSSWSIEVGTARSLSLATADSGTMAWCRWPAAGRSRRCAAPGWPTPWSRCRCWRRCVLDRAGDRLAAGVVRSLSVDGTYRSFSTIGALLEARRPFHDHRVLVELVVDGRHRALAEGVVERVVDRARASRPGARRRRGRPSTKVSTPLSDWSLSTSVSAVSCFSRSASLLDPGAQVGQVVALERVLVGRVARAPAHAQVLHRAEEHAQAGELVELRAQPRRSPPAVLSRALGHRLEVDEHEAAARAPAAREADHRVDRRVLADDVDRLLQLLGERGRRDALVGAQAAVELPVVLLREVALGNVR